MLVGMDAFLVGVLAGIAYALSGYLKSMKAEKFDAIKFSRTVIIGIVAGLYAAYKGMDICDAYGFVMASGAVAYIENILKFIYRHIKK